MKKILFALLLCLPLLSIAKGKGDDSKYLLGAVPEVNGVVTFQKTISVAGKSQAQVYQAINNYMQNAILGNAIEGLRTRVISDGKQDGNIVVKAEEYMIFKKKALNLDRTRFRYQLSANTTEGKCELTLNQVSYYYNEDMNGENGVTFKGEEWITDKEAVNKKGTALYPRSGKFRRKTIDRVEEIFAGAEAALK